MGTRTCAPVAAKRGRWILQDGVRGVHRGLGLYSDLNSGPHGCVASILLIHFLSPPALEGCLCLCLCVPVSVCLTSTFLYFFFLSVLDISTLSLSHFHSPAILGQLYYLYCLFHSTLLDLFIYFLIHPCSIATQPPQCGSLAFRQTTPPSYFSFEFKSQTTSQL